jgi:hypothetical protein
MVKDLSAFASMQGEQGKWLQSSFAVAVSNNRRLVILRKKHFKTLKKEINLKKYSTYYLLLFITQTIKFCHLFYQVIK